MGKKKKREEKHLSKLATKLINQQDKKDKLGKYKMLKNPFDFFK